MAVLDITQYELVPALEFPARYIDGVKARHAAFQRHFFQTLLILNV